jgi:hypothetical protein
VHEDGEATKKTSRGRKQDRARVAGGQDYEDRDEAKKTRRTSGAVTGAVAGNSRKHVERRLGPLITAGELFLWPRGARTCRRSGTPIPDIISLFGHRPFDLRRQYCQVVGEPREQFAFCGVSCKVADQSALRGIGRRFEGWPVGAS